MPSHRVVANAAKTICPTCSMISQPSWMGRVKQTLNARTNRLYTRLTATEVRRQLIVQKGYTDEELPTAETIASKLNMLGYSPKKVAKSQPQKNSPRRMPSSLKAEATQRGGRYE
jgi:hypothetical protein